ncbi:LytR/AlgR family response regulator transcription factor [Nonlabens ulvanivorans]|uniref:LytTR family two component transcriptional regulator n=1 Tax=Nonlabens ulvanivorans TaxID=906888 RepID=A0A084JWP0_NONUL|nr:LytTR family DNA-binding domain-containing protein [Nonlabens ulvanivorans]KEZ93374.1 hypothetical protein IL45_03910 [Nonlabens ulvanivorans]PRX13956.1 LytTR family two component transcriptional regulator [Nonlabens ulvanivorans]|tara:strand:- start:57 stop:758 length:702 start_codon:yes stop_codon:yes gene_type:complete
MIKCLVIDDEPHAAALIADYVEKSKELILVGTYTNPIEAFHFLNNNTIDLLFLDIQMPELSGMQLHKIINNKSQVIFTTAYDQYAVDSFSLDVIDFLLKPISFDRFLLSVEKLKKRLQTQVSIKEGNIKSTEYIFVKSGYKTMRINFSDIFYFEASNDYVEINTSSGKILTLDNMGYFESTLPENQFIRVHRSFIISISKIDFIEKNRVIIVNRYIPISKTYQKKFQYKIGRE